MISRKNALPVLVSALIAASGSAAASQWSVISVDGTPAMGTPVIVFAESAISGDTGCNRFNATGTFEAADGTLVVSSPVATTRMACPGETLTAQDDKIIAMFEGSIFVAFDVFSDLLTLTSSDITLVLARQAEADTTAE